MQADQIIRAANDTAESRSSLWIQILRDFRVRSFVEVGVWRGEFAETVLKDCAEIDSYTMIDPWRVLPDWNKPFNSPEHNFDAIYAEALQRTEFAAERRRVLRSRTIEAADEIADGSVDAIYIDGDHTLRGIAIDMIAMLPKLRSGGLLCGDDFTRSVWQHDPKFDPTFVFPFAIYFAEAHRLPIYSLKLNQFAIVNDPAAGFSFTDLAGGYSGRNLAEILRVEKRGILSKLFGRR